MVTSAGCSDCSPGASSSQNGMPVSFLPGQPLFTNAWSHVLNSFHCDRFFCPGKAAGIILHLESWFAAGSACKNRWKESKTGEKIHLRTKSQISAHLPTLFPSTEWNSGLVRFLFPIFETECKVLQPYCHFPRYLIVHQGPVWVCVLVFVERFLV